MLEAESSEYLTPGQFVESDSVEIHQFVSRVTQKKGDLKDRVVQLFYAVRDEVAYDPYDDFYAEDVFSARRCLERKRGFCIPKAALMAAGCRTLGVPARIGFADVKNHLASPRILKANGGPVFFWHAFTEVWLGERWLKATPTFDVELCKRAKIKPLDFDGENDSIFHEFDEAGNHHMDYVKYRGSYADVPAACVLNTWRSKAPGILKPDFVRKDKAFIDEI